MKHLNGETNANPDGNVKIGQSHMADFLQCNPSKRVRWGVFVGQSPTNTPTFTLRVGETHANAIALNVKKH